jgi:hypothetical protein
LIFQQKKMSDNLPKEVYSGSLIEATMIREMLRDYNIEAFILNEFEGTMAPFRTSPGGTDPIRLTVGSDQYDQAMVYIKEFNENILPDQ